MSNTDGDEKNAIETSFDHKFARDLIHFVLYEHMTGLGWIPDGIFQERDLDTPFTPQLKAAVREELAHAGHEIHETFDQCFPDKSIIGIKFAEFVNKAKDGFVEEPFSVGEFISFSVLLSMFAGLSYLYGVTLAPFVTYVMIVKTIQKLKRLGKINNNVWNEIQTALENRNLPRRLWTSVIDSSSAKL